MKIRLAREELHQTIYRFALALLVCCLPLSRYLLSLSQFVLLINWLLQGQYRQKIRLVRQDPSILVFASVFLVYCAGLLLTQDLTTGLARVKNALPILLLPLVIGTSRPLPAKDFRQILLLFSAAVTAAAMVCLIKYFSTGNAENGGFREVSLFMHHIRFSLMIVLSIFILLYFLFYDKNGKVWVKSYALIDACFLLAFLIFLRSFTGIIIFLVLAFAFMLNITFRSRNALIRYGILCLAGTLLIGIFAGMLTVYRHNFRGETVRPDTLALYTANGNRYIHDVQTRAMENGHYIDLYVCEPEMKKEWEKFSRLPYDGNDLRGQSLHYTLRRYLTSKALRKDSAGISRLDEQDIRRIENGLANYWFRNDPGINQRLYETLWEIHILSATGYVKHHSVGQRIAFVLAAEVPLKENLWTGVGSGDVYNTLLRSAKDKKLAVDPLWEGKPHNQFLFFILAFGLPGFLYLMFCFVWPVVVNKTYMDLLFNSYAGTILISMLVLDTFESYDSMVFLAFFYSLFVFGKKTLTP